MRTVSLVVPFYNEEENVLNTISVLDEMASSLTRYQWQLVAVNDGSRDRTLELLHGASAQNLQIVVIDLSRNFGKEAALSAGIAKATGDAVIPMDADLQDPPSVVPELLAHWEQGSEVVLARRVDRSSDSYLKRGTAKMFYRVINSISEVKIPSDVGDFRLMTRPVVDAIAQLPENRRFMKGLFAWAGFRTTEIGYVRQVREAGTTKFSGWRLWNLAIEGVTSFSIAPLKVWTYLGLLVAASAFAYGFYIVARTILYGVDVPGYASLLTILLFTTGIQLVGLGVIGEYIGRIYFEAKGRPPYLVRQITVTEARGRGN